MPKSIECPNCGALFRDHCDFKRHQNRKHPCKGPTDPGVSMKCEKCGKLFNHPNSIYIHRKNCHVTPVIKNTDKNTINGNSNNLSNNSNGNNIADSNFGSDNTINDNSINNSEVTVNNYYFPDLSYLTDDMVNGIVKSQVVKYAVPALFKEIYLNDEHPENNSIKVNKDNKDDYLIMDKKGWISLEKNFTIHQGRNTATTCIINKINAKREVYQLHHYIPDFDDNLVNPSKRELSTIQGMIESYSN